MPRIPLIEELTTESVPIGSVLLVEFDAASQWYNSSISIAATWLKEGGTCRYGVAARPPEKLRAQMGRLGVNAQEFETNGKLCEERLQRRLKRIGSLENMARSTWAT